MERLCKFNKPENKAMLLTAPFWRIKEFALKACIAVTVLADPIVTTAKGVIPPTEPSNRIAPDPADMERFWLPFSVLLNVIAPPFEVMTTEPFNWTAEV